MIDSHLNHFELHTKLGTGSVGEVWRAQVDGRTVAVKFINHADDPRQRQSFETEIAALRCLDHPAVPALYDSDLRCERPYIMMEFIAGEPFHRVIADGAIWQIPLERRLAILDQIAAAAEHLHERGLIHRDIKPANIIGVDEPHLIDYGIAAEVGAEVSPAGTPFYMFPGEQAPSAAHDVFGFALTAYEFLFGVHAIFTAQDGGLPRDEVRARARARLSESTWRLPSRVPAHELPYDLRGVELARLDALFARAFDWQASEPMTLMQIGAELRAIILTADNQPYMDGMPDMVAALDDTGIGELPAAATTPPELPPRVRRIDAWLALAIFSGAAILLIVILFGLGGRT